MRRVSQVPSITNCGRIPSAIRDDRRGIASLSEILLLGFVACVVWLAIRTTLAPDHEAEPFLEGSGGGPIVGVSVISDGGKILALRGVSEIVSFDLVHDRIQMMFEWNDRPIKAVCFSQDGEICLLSIDDRELLLFRGKELLKSEFLNAKSSVQVALSLSGKSAIRVVDGTSVRRWDLSSDEIVESDYSFNENIERISLDFDGDRMLVVDSRGALQLCYAKSGVVYQKLEGNDHPRADPVFSRDGSCVVVARNRSVSLYELPSGRVVWTVPFDDQDWLTSVAISPNGQFVAACGISVPVRVLSRAGGEVLHQFSKTSTSGVAFSISSDAVYTGARDGSICQWSLADGRMVEYGKAD